MTLQASGPISFSQIANEFGTPPGKNLGAYRVSQTISGLTNLALDNEVSNTGIITAVIPQSGQIKFSDFYSKKLNVVVDCTPEPGLVREKVIGRNRYNNNNGTSVIGNFKQTRPDPPENIKVWIHTNGQIGSNRRTFNNQIPRTYSSLVTGTWSSSTDLKVDIGPDGFVTGSGGDGGAGGNGAGKSASAGLSGFYGSSAIGVNETNAPIIITNRGRIQGGGGGGGGGGASWNENRRGRRRDLVYNAGGGGGGGGWGYPSGRGGTGGIANGRDGADPGDVGFDGSLLFGGNGGTGGGTTRDSGGGGGGGARNGERGLNGNDPGSAQPNATGGNDTSGGTGGPGYALGGSDGRTGLGGAGGAGGLNGYSIVIQSDGSNVSIITGSEAVERGSRITNTDVS